MTDRYDSLDDYDRIPDDEPDEFPNLELYRYTFRAYCDTPPYLLISDDSAPKRPGTVPPY